MRKRLLSIVSAAVIVTGLFAGCGNSGKDNSSSDTNKKVTLKVGVWSSSPAETKLLDSQIAAFTKAHPNITLEKQVITGDYNQAMQTKIASKTEPDLFYLDVSLAQAYISKGALAPLDEYLDKEDLKDFSPNLLAGYQKDGKTYGLPKDTNVLALFYNKDMLSKAGVSVPTTWAELQDAAKKLTTDKVKGLALQDDVARWGVFANQSGSKIYDNGKLNVTSEGTIKGLDFYTSFIKDGTGSDPKSLGAGWGGEAFYKEKAAMTFEGGWLIPAIAESAPNLKYGIALLPKGDNDGNYAFTVSYSMSKDTKNAKEAAEAIKFLTGKEAQQMTAESGLAMPTRTSLGDVYVSKFPERKALVDGVANATVYTYGLEHAKVNDALTNACTEVRLGKSDAKTALEKVKTSIGQ
ncbi:ABC transporter substrate-binding protein [Clostridium folliculivorans]|uniref:ABC transporter substrate-binding protein n=1 Tax=Clostridium folliculivorans TaxID=2886038 RepID=A0A9W5Y5E3_9CLOT|nr:ABC transporter substrate-binding protein [Clostridium folliculivorans]GKU27039.1 ABC transporter substrate-binding protein [Clostridium folliculivorans]GKU29119.1 ABC transporter substrate-binding protein [Clostridium folliculivorans]